MNYSWWQRYILGAVIGQGLFWFLALPLTLKLIERRLKRKLINDNCDKHEELQGSQGNKT